jgi:hypothetical protein
MAAPGLRAAAGAWAEADPIRRNALARTILDAVLVRRATGSTGRFDPGRIEVVPRADCQKPDRFRSASNVTLPPS